MKKQGGQLVILVVVLAVLAAGYFGLVRYNKGQQEQEADLVEGEVLVDVSSNDILRFSYVYNGETYAFERAEVPVAYQESDDADDAQPGGGAQDTQTESRWVSAADPSLNLMQNRLNVMAGKFTRIIAQNTISDVTDLSQYGLEEPSNTLHWETAQGVYTY
ncbi:MAG: DUF4340 domain-containing protein, partial [Acetatifactor sp.]|nr:DUF4340 domain-containing protein [Acetatifactor sp.]